MVFFFFSEYIQITSRGRFMCTKYGKRDEWAFSKSQCDSRKQIGEFPSEIATKPRLCCIEFCIVRSLYCHVTGSTVVERVYEYRGGRLNLVKLSENHTEFFVGQEETWVLEGKNRYSSFLLKSRIDSFQNSSKDVKIICRSWGLAIIMDHV